VKIIKNNFLAQVHKIQTKCINNNYTIGFISPQDMRYKSINRKYLLYVPEGCFCKLERILDKIKFIKVSISSQSDIKKSKGKLFRYNVSELYLDNGAIISL
jgi:hypothetical protein